MEHESVTTLPDGREVIVSEDISTIYIEGISLNTICLPKQRAALEAIRAVVCARLDRIEIEEERMEEKERKRGRKKGQVVEQSRPAVRPATQEQLIASGPAYREHVRICRENGVEFADRDTFARQFCEVREVEEREPVGKREAYHPHMAYPQYVSPRSDLA